MMLAFTTRPCVVSLQSLQMAQPDFNHGGEEPTVASAGESGAVTNPRGPALGEQVGEYVGPWKLLSRLGEGGFGVVWLAERKQPLVQRVALKIIKPGMDSRAVLARFDQERHALAMMDHPGVARALDAGATSNGRPYFAMEYVKGVPITTYANQHGLTLRDRMPS